MKTDPNALAYPGRTAHYVRGMPGTWDFQYHPGLSKREAFVLAAMQGLLAGDVERSCSAKTIAQEAIIQADIQIAALNEESQNAE